MNKPTEPPEDPNPPVDDPIDQTPFQFVPSDEEPSNVVDGVPHFVLVVPGQEDVCGGCGKPWPCPDAPQLPITPVE